MKLYVYNHSAYGYIIRATNEDEAAGFLAFLIGDNPVHPHTLRDVLRGLTELSPEGEAGVIEAWPG
jgi:hypothetical protein